MAYIFLTCIVMASVDISYAVMADIFTECVVMASITDIVVACVVITY